MIKGFEEILIEDIETFHRLCRQNVINPETMIYDPAKMEVLHMKEAPELMEAYERLAWDNVSSVFSYQGAIISERAGTLPSGNNGAISSGSKVGRTSLMEPSLDFLTENTSPYSTTNRNVIPRENKNEKFVDLSGVSDYLKNFVEPEIPSSSHEGVGSMDELGEGRLIIIEEEIDVDSDVGFEKEEDFNLGKPLVQTTRKKGGLFTQLFKKNDEIAVSNEFISLESTSSNQGGTRSFFIDEKYFYPLTVFFLMISLLFYGAQKFLDLYRTYRITSEKFAEFMLKNMSFAILTTAACILFLWFVHKKLRKKKIIVFLSISLAALTLYSFNQSTIAFREQRQFENLSLQALTEMTSKFLSEKGLEEAVYGRDKYGEYGPLLQLTNLFYRKLQFEAVDIQDKSKRFDLENILTTETYKSLSKIEQGKDKLIKFETMLEEFDKRYQVYLNDFYDDLEEEDVIKEYKEAYKNNFKPMMIEASGKMRTHFKTEKENAKKIENILSFMKGKNGRYLVTNAELKFMTVEDNRTYKKLMNDFYDSARGKN